MNLIVNSIDELLTVNEIGGKAVLTINLDDNFLLIISKLIISK